MKGIGSTIRHVEKVRLNTRLAIRTMANGQTIKQISSEFTRLPKVPGMKVSGETINSMATALKI